MWRLVRICILVICSGTVVRGIAQPSPIDLVVTDTSLQRIVQIVAADSFMGRFTGSQQAIDAAHYIANEFINAGAMPVAGNDGFFISFYKNGPAVNIIAALPGKSKANEIVLFSAHYDHIGTSSSEMPWRMPEHGDPDADKLDYPLLAKVVKAIALGCSGIVEGLDNVTQ